MSKLTIWMIAYGLLLLGADLADITALNGEIGLSQPQHLCGWAGGAVMVVAGLAACQGRRSLRLSGVFLGTMLPVLVGLLLAWRSGRLWQGVRAGSEGGIRPAVVVTCLALASLAACWAIVRVRPREGIASRGYAVTTPIPKRPIADEQPPVAEPQRRSEAG